MHGENTILRACDLRRGMVVLPFKGSYYPKPKDPSSLDWKQTMYAEWWQHIVLGSDGESVTLGRPYAYAREHFDSNHPLLSCEVYKVQRDSEQPFMIMRCNFTT